MAVIMMKKTFLTKVGGSGGSYTGEEGLCPECRLVSNFAKGENNPPSAFKCKDEKICLQAQKDKLEELEKKSDRTDEEKAEMQRLAKNLGVNPSNKHDKEREEAEKKGLGNKINTFQQALKAHRLNKGHLGFSEYDKENLEKELAKAKAEYKSKFGELPASLNDNDDNIEREREREREQKWQLSNCLLGNWRNNISGSNWSNCLPINEK
jgi:hypothetical protein